MMLRVRHTVGDWGEAIGASAVVHVAAAVLVFDLAGDLNLRTPPKDTTPPINVTSLVLGSDTATTSTDSGEGTAALIEAGPDDVAQQVAPETLDPVEARDDPDVAESVEPGTPEPVPAVGRDDGVAAIEPSLLRPTETITTLGGSIVAGQGVSAIPPERIGALKTTALIDTTPRSAFPPNDGSGSDPTTGELSELVRRIRAQLSASCLLAIPQDNSAAGSELLMIGNTDTEMRAFADGVLDGLLPRPAERSVLVDNRQCGALNYVRQSEAYPTFRLTVALDAQTVISGDTLGGTIGRVSGRYVTLVLVDDNGVVQDIGDYLAFREGFARFDVPVTRAGLSRDTSQLLIAFGSSRRPRTVDVENGQLAERYFTALREELGPNTPMVMIPFNIREP